MNWRIKGADFKHATSAHFETFMHVCLLCVNHLAIQGPSMTVTTAKD